ncbi:MAG: formate dehydrogenase [Deltaproteobacteria bacterium HGW-Deltaproteobacteria-6]|jgi:hypothetical protein|nr:MAG: formate dehydrogenase [Deltaproteobacteria bacterium HGW-Deltaproteobacteria-6]
MEIKVSSGRRTFLKRAVLLGGSALFAGVSKKIVSDPATPDKEPKPADQGYRLTAHIKKYYETAGQ